MNRLLTAISFLIILQVVPKISLAQPVFKKLNAVEIPSSIKFKGTAKQAITWNDSTGKHFVVLAEEGPIKSTDRKDSLGFCEEEDCKDAFLYAYHFVQKQDSINLVWKTMDYVTQCSFDLYVSFEKNSLSITDLDKNGIPEIWFIYKTTCTSDVSPRAMKLLMYEGRKKQIIRGLSRVKVSATGYIGGTERKFDSNFNTSSQPVKEFAVKLWDKFVNDTYN